MHRILKRLAGVVLVCGLACGQVFADAALRAEEARRAAVAGEPSLVWVATDAISASGELAPGTPLRSAADATAAPVGVFRAGESFAIQRIDGDWTQIRVFPASRSAAPAPAPAPAPVGEAAPVPVAVVAVPSAPTLPSAESQKEWVSRPTLLPGDYNPVRTFSGTLEKVRGFIWTMPPAAYELIDKDGYRVAFLDLKDLLKTVDIESSLGRQVQVSGRVEAVRRGRDVLMKVETLAFR
jgi:hypothetical protein